MFVILYSSFLACLWHFYPVSALQCTNITVSSSAVYIQSHSTYPSGKYSKNYQACWLLKANSSSRAVGITSDDFDVQPSFPDCNQDKLTVYNSNSRSGQSISFCGRNTFDDLYSSQRYMYLYFSTDGSKHYKGFKLKVNQYSKSYYDSDRWSTDYYQDGGFQSWYIGVGVGIPVLFVVLFAYQDHRKKKLLRERQAQEQAQKKLKQEAERMKQVVERRQQREAAEAKRKEEEKKKKNAAATKPQVKPLNKVEPAPTPQPAPLPAEPTSSDQNQPSTSIIPAATLYPPPSNRLPPIDPPPISTLSATHLPPPPSYTEIFGTDHVAAPHY